jgi:outer membrane protein OmpA-like peptidoglycan-associated protein
MRGLPTLTVAFLTAALLAAAGPVFAQVTVDLHALQALPERSAPSQPARPRYQSAPEATTRTPSIITRVPPLAQTPATVTPSAQAPAASGPVASAPIASPPAPQPALPETVPQTASITPIAPPPPPAGSPPPPPPPISDTSATNAAPTTAGLRLTFAPDQSDLSPESSASIKQLTTTAPPGDDTTFEVQAFAPGKPDDPSTARRVSLSRAMSVRAALVADGVPSARIFVRALGEQYGSGPPDRVDIAVNGAPGAAASR